MDSVIEIAILIEWRALGRDIDPNIISVSNGVGEDAIERGCR